MSRHLRTALISEPEHNTQPVSPEPYLPLFPVSESTAHKSRSSGERWEFSLFDDVACGSLTTGRQVDEGGKR
jgi:hypothetical protein